MLTVSGTVTEVNETFREITVKAAITNQNGQKVTRGSHPRGVAVRVAPRVLPCFSGRMEWRLTRFDRRA